MDLKKKYQIFSSDTWNVIDSFDKIEDVIENLKPLINNLKEDWILDDIEKNGISDVGIYEVLNMNFKNGSEHYDTVKNIIKESV